MPRPTSDTPAQTATPEPRVRALLAYALAVPFVILAVASILADHCWPCAMFANLALPLALLALFAAAITAALGRPIPSAAALFAALLLAAHLFFVERAPPGGETDARILVFNAYAEVHDNTYTLELLRKVDADIVLLNECNFKLTQDIRADEVISERYPYTELSEHDKQWARGVLSVWPLERLEKRDERWRELRFEYLYRRAQLVRHPETPFIATVTAFESPRSAARWRTGNRTMRRDADLLREYVLRRDYPAVVGIDLNATPTARRSRQFTGITGLRRAKPFAVPAGTWPSTLPPFLRAPIDDLLVTDGVRITSWRTVESTTNSDHVPVLVGIDLPDADNGPTSQGP